VPSLGDRGAGTISAVHAEEMEVDVIWDSGEAEGNVPIGAHGQYHLTTSGGELRPSRTAQSPTPKQQGSLTVPLSQFDAEGGGGEMQDSAAASDRRSVDGLALRSQSAISAVPYASSSPQVGSPRPMQTQARVVPLQSPRVMQTRRAGDDRDRSPVPALDDGLSRIPRSRDRPDLSLSLWEKMITVGPGEQCMPKRKLI
jgi:hypothetical protein